MNDQLHDKILSCDELSTKSLTQLKKMKRFYKIKNTDLIRNNFLHKCNKWTVSHHKLHTALLLASILVFVVSFYITIKVSVYAIIISVISMLYIFLTGAFTGDVRTQAMRKNIATIEYMIQANEEKQSNKKSTFFFRHKARIVYECIRDSPGGGVNLSELLKAVRTHDPRMDKNTLKKILKEDLMEVIIEEKGPYTTGQKSLLETTIYKLKKL